MSLNIEEREAIVRFKIEKSYRTLEEAKGNVTLKFWPAAANRLYYAAYYAVSALLVANGDAANTCRCKRRFWDEVYQVRIRVSQNRGVV